MLKRPSQNPASEAHAVTGPDQIAAGFAVRDRSAALMPYLMGGFPPLVAPTTPKDQLAMIAGCARGFVYVVSVTGVTGERAELPPELRGVVEGLRESASVPAAVGFGIGTPDQAAAVAEIADGVIIGS